MADRGFVINDLLEALGCTLIMNSMYIFTPVITEHRKLNW